ncbi:MAG TPA: hypothetical protein VFR12_14040 [Pyrinomonadaceae bacterium]|nr:hypothetical protein [Pyrinomonadaceae bacterium]
MSFTVQRLVPPFYVADLALPRITWRRKNFNSKLLNRSSDGAQPELVGDARDLMRSGANV